MAHYDFFKLLENKDRFIDNNPNLTPEQKTEIKDYFRSHSNQESKIDWNNYKRLTYNDFLTVMRSVSANAQKKHRLFDVKEGEDYVYLGKSEIDGRPVEVYQPLTWKGSCALASNQFGPECWSKTPSWNGPDEANSWGKARGDGLKPGAKWCISMHTTDRHWEDYTENYVFLFVFDPTAEPARLKKAAITLREYDGELESVNDVDDNYISEYDYVDIAKEFYPKMNPMPVTLPKEFVYNPETERYDVVDEYFDMRPYITNGRLIVPIGDYTGHLYLPLNVGVTITSLENFPTRIIGGGLNLDRQPIESLKGCPKYMDGDLSLIGTRIKSLEGLSEHIVGSLLLSETHITDFRGAENTTVEGELVASYCRKLVSCEGFPENVGRGISFESSFNLASLKGMPDTIYADFVIRDCTGLTSLEGCPRRIDGNFSAQGCEITSLKGGPEIVLFSYRITDSEKLTSLEGIADEIGGNIMATGCPLNPEDTACPRQVEGYYKGPETVGTQNLPKPKRAIPIIR